MAKLVHIAITSLDGYVEGEDEGGTFDWAVADEEVHALTTYCDRLAVTSVVAGCTRQ